MSYKTPRMLARTLKMLRDRRGRMTLENLSREIGLAHNTISCLESRRTAVSYKHLDRYQHFFGAPNGLILCISHIAALARDAAAHEDRAVRERERRRLRVMGLYLRNLSDRILNPGKRPELARFPDVTCAQPSSWDFLLNDLMHATQLGLSKRERLVFEDHDRVRAIRDGEV